MTRSMALEADPRARHFERGFVHATMRVMTVVTVLAHRQMLKQEWPALFGMAGVANVIDRIFFQERFGEAAMRIVTVRADHLAFAQGHV